MQIKRFPAHASMRDMRRIGRQYESAMARRREPTDPEFLAYVWREYGALHVRSGRNFLMLHRCGRVFIPSHIAPVSLRGGAELLREVYASRLPVFFAVTGDLVSPLERIGWRRLPSWIQRIMDGRLSVSGKIFLRPSIMACLRALFPIAIEQPCSQKRFRTYPKGPKRSAPSIGTKLANVWPIMEVKL
jgi:hypothetical protein